MEAAPVPHSSSTRFTNVDVILSSESFNRGWAPGGEAFYYFSRVNQTVSLYKIVFARDRGPDAAPILLLSGLESDERFTARRSLEGLRRSLASLVAGRPLDSREWRGVPARPRRSPRRAAQKPPRRHNSAR